AAATVRCVQAGARDERRRARTNRGSTEFGSRYGRGKKEGKISKHIILPGSDRLGPKAKWRARKRKINGLAADALLAWAPACASEQPAAGRPARPSHTQAHSS